MLGLVGDLCAVHKSVAGFLPEALRENAFLPFPGPGGSACAPLLTTLTLHLHAQPQSDPSCVLTFLWNDNQEKFPTFRGPHD